MEERCPQSGWNQNREKWGLPRLIPARRDCSERGILSNQSFELGIIELVIELHSISWMKVKWII